MEQSMELKQAQLGILRLLGRMKTIEQIEELRQVISNYYARKATEEMDKLWDSGEWGEAQNNAVLNEHLRTPYRVWNELCLVDSDYVEFFDPQFKLELITADPDDNKFVDCAFAANATFIVSQDHHFDILDSIDFPKIAVMRLQSFALMLRQ